MKSIRYCLALIAVGIAPSLGLSPRAVAQDVDTDVLYNKVVKSCVFILLEVKSKNALFLGSGSLIDAQQKLILTNYHVVGDEPYVFVQFPIYVKGKLLTDKSIYMNRYKRGELTKSKVLYRDKSRDLAIVRADKVPAGTGAIPLAKNSPRRGTTVWQIGNAGAITQAFRISKGDVSAVGREKYLVGGDDEVFAIHAMMVTSTTPTNPGDSGGPLFDKRGYQVAVTESGNDGASLVNHFVDITEVRTFLNESKIKIKELSDEPDPTPEKKSSAAGTPEKKGGSATTPAADERMAADQLRRAKLFANGEEFRPAYIQKLKEIVKKWPNTVAGKEAKKRLDELK